MAIDGAQGGMRLRGQPYYWIVADYGGRLVIIGPKNSEEEATEFAYQKLDVTWEVVPLATRSRAAAASQLKAKKLGVTGDLGQSIQRSMRRAPGDYKRRWWREQGGDRQE